MKRFFAVALVLCMALSMMAMTASAATPAGVDINECSCSKYPTATHAYIVEPGTFPGNPPRGRKYVPNEGYVAPTSPTLVRFNSMLFTAGTTSVPVGWYYSTTDDLYIPCPGPHAVGDPEPKAQPKTGVADTLPIWFGVMAVSACAYVLTSKKKVF